MINVKWRKWGGALTRIWTAVGAGLLPVMLVMTGLLWSNRLPYRFRYYVDVGLRIGFYISLGLLIGMLISGIAAFRRGDYRLWLRRTALGAAYSIGAGFLLILGVLYHYIGPVRDRFADHLPLPEKVVLTTPAPPLGRIDFRQAPPESFQYQVLNAVNDGIELEDDQELEIPALAKLTSTAELREKLYAYLAANPEYRLYTDPRGGLHATRRFVDPTGEPVPAGDGYYSYFGGQADDRYTYRLDIGLEGLSWNGRFARSGAVIDPTHRHHSTSRFWAGEALVEIIEESGNPGRPMTAKTVELLEKEFAAVLKSPGFPKGERRLPRLTLRGEKGVYVADFYCNPGEPGEIYLKAEEITENIPLSRYRLRTNATERIGFSDDPGETFPGQIRFTIYEGDWGQFYGMHLELHFRADDPEGFSGKMLEGDFKIEGWMRSPTP